MTEPKRMSDDEFDNTASMAVIGGPSRRIVAEARRAREIEEAALDLLERFAEPAKPDQTTWRAVRALLKKAGRR